MNEVYSIYNGVKYRYYFADETDEVINKLLDHIREGLEEATDTDDSLKYNDKSVSLIKQYRKIR